MVPETVSVPPAAERLAVNVPRSKLPLVTDKFPVIDVFTPRVVIPPLIVKLLKLVNIVAGKVFVASIVTVPVPGVHVFPATVLTVRLPVLSVPPAVIVIIPAAGVAPAFPRVTLPASSVDPLVKEIVPVLLVFPEPPSWTFPETVSVNAPPNVRVPPKFVLPAILEQAELTFTVTVKPLSRITISPATGKTPLPTRPPPEVRDQVFLFVQTLLARE
jgi:hypothetical protein